MPPTRPRPADTQSCGVNYWRGNSAIAHLVSNTPQGPFAFLDMALPVWHTNPHVVRDPRDGTFVLFALGQSVNPKNWTQCDCTKSPACPPGPPNPNLAGVIDAHWAVRACVCVCRAFFLPPPSLPNPDRHAKQPTPYGPWTPVTINGSTIVLQGATNPAPFFLPNGTLVLGLNAEGTKVAVVEDWRTGPYIKNPTETMPNIPNNWYEDPFIWLDPITNKWRQLVHQYNATHPGTTSGGYGENAGGSVFAPWVYGGLADPAYTNNVTYVDGSVQALRRRERPKLLFAADKRVWLYTAVQSALNASRDFSYTLVQEVLQWAER